MFLSKFYHIFSSSYRSLDEPPRRNFRVLKALWTLGTGVQRKRQSKSVRLRTHLTRARGHSSPLVALGEIDLYRLLLPNHSKTSTSWRIKCY